MILLRTMALAVLMMVVLPEGTVYPENASDRLRIKVRTSENIRSVEDADRLVTIAMENRVDEIYLLIKSDEEEPGMSSGLLFYPGKIAPVAVGYAEKDLIGYFLDKAHQRGIRVMAWVPLLKDAVFWQNHPNARAMVVTKDGQRTEQPNWLSPFSPEVFSYLNGLITEIVTTYPFDGLILDYIRYNDDFASVDDASLQAFEKRYGKPLPWRFLRKEGRRHSRVWKRWVNFRAERIAEIARRLVQTARKIRPDLRIGATLLPFSAGGYYKNTVSGQDYQRLSGTGLDFISPLGYWDDWFKSPQWMSRVYKDARQQVGSHCEVIMAMDGDMTFGSTAATWAALPTDHRPLLFFFGEWTDDRLAMLRSARQTSFTNLEQLVCIRIDTEPNAAGEWDVPDDDFYRLLDLFSELHVPATWVTVGKFARTRGKMIQRLYAAGHEVALHGWEHERFEDLPDREEKARRIALGLQAMKEIGVPIHGFGAPQNSIDTETRQILIENGFEYDGSLALDPQEGQWLAVRHFSNHHKTLLILPYLYPNDYDGFTLAHLNVDGMFREWKKRFDINYKTGRAPFVIDVHQWLIGQPSKIAALRKFIRYARSKSNVKFVRLQDIAEKYRKQALMPVAAPPVTRSHFDSSAIWQGILKFLAFFPLALALQYIVFSIIFRLVIERRAVYHPRFTPRVSVLVPAHNEAEHIRKTLEAIKASDYPNFDLTLIDDGSHDDTAAIAEQVGGVRVICLTENKGKAHALNHALQKARGDIIVCIDADTIIEKQTLRYLVQQFTDRRIAGITGNPQIRSRKGFLRKLQTMEYATIISLIKRAETLLGGLYTVSGAICAFRRSVLEKIGGWDESTQTEDIEISWRVQKLGYRITYEPRAVCWISVPGKYGALFRQRVRWSRGSGEAYRKHLKIVTSPNTATIPIIFMGIISSIWALAVTLIFPLLTARILPGLTHGLMVLATGVAFIHVQSGVGLFLDKKYNSQLLRYFTFTPFFIIYFWTLVLPSFLYGFFRGLLGEKTGVWKIQRE